MAEALQPPLPSCTMCIGQFNGWGCNHTELHPHIGESIENAVQQAGLGADWTRLTPPTEAECVCMVSAPSAKNGRSVAVVMDFRIATTQLQAMTGPTPPKSTTLSPNLERSGAKT